MVNHTLRLIFSSFSTFPCHPGGFGQCSAFSHIFQASSIQPASTPFRIDRRQIPGVMVYRLRLDFATPGHLLGRGIRRFVCRSAITATRIKKKIESTAFGRLCSTLLLSMVSRCSLCWIFYRVIEGSEDSRYPSGCNLVWRSRCPGWFKFGGGVWVSCGRRW